MALFVRPEDFPIAAAGTCWPGRRPLAALRIAVINHPGIVAGGQRPFSNFMLYLSVDCSKLLENVLAERTPLGETFLNWNIAQRCKMIVSQVHVRPKHHSPDTCRRISQVIDPSIKKACSGVSTG